MKSKHVIVEVVADHIGLFIHEGERCVVDERIDIEPQEDALEWAKLLRRSAVTLQTLVKRLGAEGLETRVVYRSLTQSLDLVNFEVKSPAQAVEAALLSCADSLPYSAMSAVTNAFVLGRDTSGDNRQTHVVVAAEREDIAEAIVYLVQESGLAFVSSTPLDAVVMANFISDELHAKKASRAALYVGRDTSFFVVTQGGRLLFNRRIDLGINVIITSLTRQVSMPGRNDVLELDLASARRMLDQYGIPDRDDVVDEANQLKGSHVIPLMQPVLQRFVVELRQSLRFGVPENVRDGLDFHITGPGAAIKGLGKLIGQELGIQLSADDAYLASVQGTATRTELGDAVADHRFLDRLNLMPNAMSSNRESHRLRRWLWTGTAAALILIVADGFRQSGRLDSAREQAAVYENQLADVETLKATGDRLRVIIGTKNELESLIAAEVGASADFRASMQELSLISPESIRLTSIQFSRLGTAIGGNISGYAFDTEAGDGTELEAYIEQLRASPLFTAVELGHIQMGSFGARRGQTFSASFEMNPVPHSLASINVAPAAGGSE